MKPRWAVTAAAAASAPAAVAALLIAHAATARTGGAQAGAAQARGAQSRAALANPGLDPGTPLLGRPAPGFALTDQFGRRVSLAQFRGKVVVLAFVDSRCTTVCPLTTVSMTDAVSLLGPGAAARVQLIGVDANPDATAVSAVRAYSRAHRMMRSWEFLTGTGQRLAAVWRAYKVYVAASHGNIDHEPAVYLIDSAGRERTVYLTQMSYTSVGQQAQIIADGLSKLLPGHPPPRRLVPLTYVRGLSPGTPATIQEIGGAGGSGQVRLGPGRPHLLAFVASWLGEVSPLAAELRVLGSYQRDARRHGWPSAVAIDETPAEPSAGALRGLLASLGGRPLGYPVAADLAGRLASGYGVQDLPWIELTAPDGKIIFRHDGWLPEAELARMVARAQARQAR